MTIKNILMPIAVLALLAGCGPNEDYKQTRKQVLAVHDKVMVDSEIAYHYHLRLDTLLRSLDSLKHTNPALDTVAARKEISALLARLDSADKAMGDWMGGFDAEKGSKSNSEAVAYFKEQKQSVAKLDRQFKATIADSRGYLERIGKYGK